MAQIESGYFTFNPSDFNMQELLQQIYVMFAEYAQMKGVNLLYRCSAGFPVSISGDRNRLQQILINLVKNALKFTEKGFIKIYAFYLSDIQSIKVQIIDTGIGITSQHQKQLFTRFGKLQDEKKLNKEGIGLGLNICKSLVQQNGGEIWVDSEKGKGSTFSFVMEMPISAVESGYDTNTNAKDDKAIMH